MRLANYALALFGGTSMLVMASIASAQGAPVQSEDKPAPSSELASKHEPGTVGEVVVTGTRLRTAGFDAPTPTQILGEEELQEAAHPNIFDTIEQLPSMIGSLSSRIGNGFSTGGLNGLSSPSMRGLGPIRTLTLIDGQRVAPATNSGIVDVGLMPQLLIKRVDVVTGGASASYGSDAVGGVVNFITDTHFTGFKGNVQAGMTNYSDDKNWLVQVAAGRSFLDNRLHMTLSGEYYDNKGVPARPPGVNGGPNGRTWFQRPGLASGDISATAPGDPQNRLFLNAQYNDFAAYGLITRGPLAGTAFGLGGSPYAFQFGSPCLDNFCAGGENTGNVLITANLDDAMRREVAYSHVSYDFTPDTELYATVSYADVRTLGQTNAGARKEGNLTIQCDNAFLPPSIASACAINGITKFRYGVSNIIFPGYVTPETERRQPRVVVGLNSDKLNIFGKPYNLQSYFQHGESDVAIDIHNVMLTRRYNAAIDAISLPNGTIVCRDPVAQSSGCVPFNVIGLNPVNLAAWNYIAPSQGPRIRAHNRQEAFSIALSGAPVRNWAGDVSVAVGAEWRQEAYKLRADWYGAGLSADSPITPGFPADPLLSTSGNNWYSGSYKNGQGSYNVKEGFAELGLPLFDGPMGKLDFNAAGRVTNYSTSGTVTTWKLGAVWDTPIHGVRLRGVLSRDVRAPNLSELFAAPVSQAATVVDRRNNDQPVVVDQRITGNTALKPEKARNLEAGVVFQPSWLEGFSASFDYYRIKIDGAVSTLESQQIVDLCQIQGSASACSAINLDGANPFVVNEPFNLASIRTSGFDIEASYRFGLDRIGMPGRLTIRGLATHIINFVEDTGVEGAAIIHAAGDNSNLGQGYTNSDFGFATPSWKGLVTETWDWDKIQLSLAERFISAGYINPDWIECQPGSCPTSTVQHPTVDHNRLPGAFYLDLGGRYEFSQGAEAYFKVDNAFDKSPPPYGSPSIYDWLGRIYRVGVRMRF
jgi:outer membrane receptor protein involved in Fe transport